MSADQVAGAKYSEHFREITEEKNPLIQELFKLGETGLKFRHKMKAVVAPYKKVHKGMQKKSKQLSVTSFLMQLSISFAVMCSMSFDHCDSLQPGTLTSF
jgi:hypothetical protein